MFAGRTVLSILQSLVGHVRVLSLVGISDTTGRLTSVACFEVQFDLRLVSRQPLPRRPESDCGSESVINRTCPYLSIVSSFCCVHAVTNAHISKATQVHKKQISFPFLKEAFDYPT